MKTQEYNKGCSFRIEYDPFGCLRKAISRVSGVVFTRKRRFLSTRSNVLGEFTFRGYSFIIEVDPWDSALWVSTKDGLKHEVEMMELRKVVEDYKVGADVMAFVKKLFTGK